VPICRPKPGGFAVFTEIYCLLFQTDGRRHCRINHFAVTVTPATLIKDQIFSNHFPVSYKKAQRHRVLNLCGVVLLSIGYFLKVSLCEPAFIGFLGFCAL
jgi:hypothetical protein